jgi:O-antigen/teichoic acid export membrane protein
MGSFCLFVFATGDWLVVFAFGADYHGTGLILLLLTLSTSISVVSMLASNGLWAIDQPRSNVVADVCGMTVMLIVAALSVHSLGALGAALASLAGAITAAAVRSFTLVRCLESHARQSSIAINPALPS